MFNLIALVPLFPLIGFIINGFFGKKLSKGLSGAIATLSVLASFIVSLIIFIQLKEATGKPQIIVNLFSWINSDTLQIPFEFLIDPLSTWFLLIITGIGFLIHLYSFYSQMIDFVVLLQNSKDGCRLILEIDIQFLS